MTRDLIPTLSSSVVSVISSYDASTDKLMFNNYGTLATMTRTTNNWIHDLSGSTGIPALNDRSTGTNIGGALITPRHAVVALHASAVVDDVFYFWDRDNTVYSRTVTGRAFNNLGVPYGDFMVITFDSDLPTAIEPLPIFPPDLYKYVNPDRFTTATRARLDDTLIVSTDQEEKSLVHRMSYVQFNQPGDDYPDTYHPNGLAAAVYTTPLNTDALPWRESMIAGDSGSPMMAIVDNQLILLGVVSTTADFDIFGNLRNINDLNRMIVDADADAGVSTGYTATQFDLSEFTNYRPDILYYPTNLPLSATSVHMFEEGLSPQYDITWSFTYELSSHTADDEFGYCMFLQDANFPLSGGGVGPDLGFTGNTLLSASLSSQPLNKPILGIGFDSLGIFASELVYSDGPTCEGTSYTPNSITIRDENFNIITTQAISAFNLVSSGKKTIRARLGNYGRKVVVDFKNEADTFYTHILTQELTGINVSANTRYRPGVSFVKPLTSSNVNGVIVSTGFHVEGNRHETDESEFTFTPLTAFAVNNVTTGPTPQEPPISQDKPKLPFLGMEPNLGCPDNICDLTTFGSDYPGTFETSVLYGMSAYIGDIDLKWGTPASPYRFVYTHDDIIRLDTGFVGNEVWDYGGVLRSSFTTGLKNSLENASYPPIDLAPDGYPYVSSTTTATSSIYKDTDTSRLKVTVYAPLSSTDWEVFVGCPFYTLSCGITDQYLCDVSRRFEQLRRVILNPINPFPECSPAVSPSVTPSASITPTPTTSITPSVTPTQVITFTPSVTPSVTPTQVITFTPSVTPSVTPSITPSVTPSVTPSITPTPSVPVSNTPPVSPPYSPTPSSTPSSTPSNTPSLTPSTTPSVTITPTPSVPVSNTPPVSPPYSPTPSSTPSSTPSNTPSLTPSTTPSVTITLTPSVPVSNTPPATPSSTPHVTPSNTPSNTPPVTPSNTPSNTPPTTPSVTPSVTPSITPSSSVTPSITPSVTPTSSVTPPVTPSNTPPVTPSITPAPSPPPLPLISQTPIVSQTPAPSPPAP